MRRRGTEEIESRPRVTGGGSGFNGGISYDKDCIEDLRFYPNKAGQDVLSHAQTIKGGRAELLYTNVHVDPVVFNRGFYTVDIRYFYRVTLNAYCSSSRPVEVEGLCVFDKRAILFGSEGGAKVFTSRQCLDNMARKDMEQCGLPVAVVESVDPIVLDAKIVDCCEKRYCDCDICEIPACVCQCFPGDLTMGDNCCRRVLVTLGQFSIIRLERDSQLLMPVFDYCMPDKDCSAGCGCTKEDPCELFQSICFPVDQFFPPNAGGDGGSCPGGCQNSGCQNSGCQNGNSCFCK